MPCGSRRFAILLVVAALSPLCGNSQPVVPSFQPRLHATTPADYRAHLESLRELVRACRADASACAPDKVGEDDKVEAGSDTFQVRWQWLRDVLDDARDPNHADRSSVLDQASKRLGEDLAQTSAPAFAAPAFAPARTTADAILARAEFRTVSKESWFDRKIAEFWQWVDGLFSGAANLGRRAPWLGLALEWGFVSLTIVAVLVWFQRTMQRQRLAIALNATSLSTDWQRESTDWAELARAQAERSDWREAVHCLYWASIVVLEGRRLWRRNHARTPREYVVLLEPGSAQQASLRSLTRIFERIWYGLRPAAHDDYLQALTLFEQLKTAERGA